MKVLNGKGVCAGVVKGQLRYYKEKETNVKRMHIEDAEKEFEKLEKAKKKALDQLNSLYSKALHEVGEANAAIFDIHCMMINDPDYNESIKNIINVQQVNAEYAVSVTAENFSSMFKEMDDEYMRARAVDVTDISNRIINCMTDSVEKEKMTSVCIIGAKDLTPSETVQLDKENVLGFITTLGSSNSHMAILARTMNVPAIVNVGEDLKKYDGETVIIDGGTGTVYISPDEEISAQMEKKQLEIQKHDELMRKYKDKETITSGGRKIHLYANIGGVSDIGAAILNDAEGIGLLRSEFLYLESNDYPTEQEQFAVYKKIIESMGGKKVIIRTLDIGADKQIDYFKLAREENPAMGFRAVRICLKRPEIFKTQLRAILRASAFGKAAIMFPMIISVDEIRRIKTILEEVKNSLRTEKISFDENIETGIMIETPAAALISDILAEEVDFFSIGSNDLTQYTLAADRQSELIEDFYNPYHDAVKKLIKITIDNAHAKGKWVGICGELGGDRNMTEWLVENGIDEISVSPPLILPMRKKIMQCG